jgi:hypothetical protein
MAFRIAVFAAFGAIAILGGRGDAQAQQGPPRMFSPGYAESLRGVLEMEESEAAKLEQQLVTSPGDFTARLRLMAYHQRGDRARRPEDRRKRIRHALWLIEHHPDSEILHSHVSRFAPSELPEADYRRALALWNAATRARPGATGRLQERLGVGKRCIHAAESPRSRAG